jgi:hypothetical protein
MVRYARRVLSESSLDEVGIRTLSCAGRGESTDIQASDEHPRLWRGDVGCSSRLWRGTPENKQTGPAQLGGRDVLYVCCVHRAGAPCTGKGR